MVPRPPADIDPLVETWVAGRPIARCHSPRFHEREFNDSTHLGRFRPFAEDDVVVPTVYGADDLRGALSETVFHDVPLRGSNRRLPRAQLERWVWSEIAPTRDLELVSLHGQGLTRLGLRNADLIDCDAAHYAETVAWSSALYAPGGPDGLCWRARQHNDSLALILFGTRVSEADLAVVREAESVAFGHAGAVVYAFAEAAGITIVA